MRQYQLVSHSCNTTDEGVLVNIFTRIAISPQQHHLRESIFNFFTFVYI